MGIVGVIIDRLSENASQETFHCAFEQLPTETKQALRIQFGHLRTFTSGFYTRLGKQASQQRELTTEQIEARATEMLRDLSDLLDKELA